MELVLSTHWAYIIHLQYLSHFISSTQYDLTAAKPYLMLLLIQLRTSIIHFVLLLKINFT